MHGVYLKHGESTRESGRGTKAGPKDEIEVAPSLRIVMDESKPGMWSFAHDYH